MALAVPTRFGQTLNIKTTENIPPTIHWQSLTCDNISWFEGIFDAQHLKSTHNNNQDIANTLTDILTSAKTHGEHFFDTQVAYQVTTQLDFPRDWGLGSSSTLIHGISDFTGANPYLLLNETMGGSGYDLACASATQPILFQRNGIEPIVEKVDFQPDFLNQLYFIYLGKKQNSREGIQRYQARAIYASMLIDDVYALTNAMLNARQLTDFEQIMTEHETLIAETLELEKVKDLYFLDYWGAIKSLGAWGGDFVLATSNRDTEATKTYFKNKGFDVFLSYNEMILS